MDSLKQYGNIKENVSRENLARRTYESKWGFLSDKEMNKFYNQSAVQREIAQSDFKEQCPYQYTGQGDSYFVSQNMYNTMMAKCRCGRPRSYLHMIKCLQKMQNKCLDEMVADLFDSSKAEAGNAKTNVQFPQTTSGEIGRIPHRYLKWELSTRYASPKHDMPGHKIDDHPYSNIFIG